MLPELMPKLRYCTAIFTVVTPFHNFQEWFSSASGAFGSQVEGGGLVWPPQSGSAIVKASVRPYLRYPEASVSPTDLPEGTMGFVSTRADIPLEIAAHVLALMCPLCLSQPLPSFAFHLCFSLPQQVLELWHLQICARKLLVGKIVESLLQRRCSFKLALFYGSVSIF